jgi:hypothetical protein
MAGLGGGLHGNGAEFSRFRGFCGLPSTVTAATSISADALARRSSGRPRPARLERVLTRSLGPSSIPSPGDGVMLGTAWIDRPVDTQGCALCFHVIPSAAWKRTMLKLYNKIRVGFLRELPPRYRVRVGA